jgi:hypothetical protein
VRISTANYADKRISTAKRSGGTPIARINELVQRIVVRISTTNYADKRISTAKRSGGTPIARISELVQRIVGDLSPQFLVGLSSPK